MQGLEQLKLTSSDARSKQADAPTNTTTTSPQQLQHDDEAVSTLTFTLSEFEKRAFKAHCAAAGLVMAQELRRFVQTSLATPCGDEAE